MHVVLVDDNPLITVTLTRLFASRRPDWQVHAFGDPIEALARIETDLAPDVVVADRRMPGLSGIGLLQAVRSRYPDAVLILLTANVPDDLPDGVDAALPKGTPAKKLLDAISEQLATR